MLRSPFAPRLTGLMARGFAAALLAGLVVFTPAAQPQTIEALGRIVTQQNISNSSDQSELPQIDYNVGRLSAVWGERSAADIDMSTTGLGTTWPRALPFGTGSMTAYQNADVVIDSAGTTHFAYTSGNRVYHRARLASGKLTGQRSIASTTFPNALRMALGLDGRLWVIWRDGDGNAIYYKFSRDGGNSWSNGSDGGVVAAESGNMFAPDIAVDRASNPHVVWYLRSGGGAKGDIRFADWNGSRFGRASLTSDGAGLYDADPSITVDGLGVQHVVWRKQTGSNWVIFYASRAPGGAWKGFTPLTTTKGDAKYAPAIGTDAVGDVYITFSNPQSGNTRRIDLFSKQVGKGWEGPLPLSRGRWDSHSAVVGSTGSAGIMAHAVHQHEAGADDGEIIYSRVLIQSCTAAALSDEAAGQPAESIAGQAGPKATQTHKFFLPFASKAKPPTVPGC
jgi:hypothetical protein